MRPGLFVLTGYLPGGMLGAWVSVNAADRLALPAICALDAMP
jgi:hypothetical protein